MNDLKPLRRIVEPLHHFDEGGNRVGGPNPSMLGDASKLYGDCSDLYGDCSHLSGNCTGLSGFCTGIEGDLNKIPYKMRAEQYDIEEWVAVTN